MPSWTKLHYKFYKNMSENTVNLILFSFSKKRDIYIAYLSNMNS